MVLDLFSDMPAKQGMRIDLSSEDTLKEVAQRLSAPFDLHGIDISALDASDIPHLSPLLTSRSSPDDVVQQARERSRSFFGNFTATRSMGRLEDTMKMNGMIQERPRTAGRSSIPLQSTPTPAPTTVPSKSSTFPYLRKVNGSSTDLGFFSKEKNKSSPDLSRAVGFDAAKPAQPTTSRDKQSRHRPAKSELNIPIKTASDHQFRGDQSTVEKQKSIFSRRLPAVLTRTKSLRGDVQMSPNSSKPSTPVRSSTKQTNGSPSRTDLKTRPAPPDKDRSLKPAMKSSSRTRSEDRALAEQEARLKQNNVKKGGKERDMQKEPHPLAQGYRKNNGSGFFGEIKTSSSKAADGLGKAGKGFFSRLTRSSSSNEKVGLGPEEEYEPRILKLPLIQQTRETRIAKSYDHCRDKTEFWMPALPWRCIDYLNGKCEEEGLYRVSGGLTNVRRWRKRFDIERDINLLDEHDLYDASIIASLFKEWIRELPEEIFPKTLQAKIAATLPNEVPGKSPVPQSLRDELSNLPPFNYYLLFAITCHLSLLLSHEPKNKMTLDNLYRCFNQSLKLDGRIFYTLVGDWRQCWQGCYTEDEYLRQEYDFLKTPYPQYYIDHGNKPVGPMAAADEPVMISSSESGASGTGRSTPEDHRPATSHTQPSHSATESDNDVLSPSRKPQRSSSDATGSSPMRVRSSVNPN